MNSKEIFDFEQGLVAYINESHLPMELKRLCVSEIYRNIVTASEKEIEQQNQFNFSMDSNELAEEGEQHGDTNA